MGCPKGWVLRMVFFTGWVSLSPEGLSSAWVFAWLGGFSENSFHSLGVLANCETTGLSSDWRGRRILETVFSTFVANQGKSPSWLYPVPNPPPPHIYYPHQCLLS